MKKLFLIVALWTAPVFGQTLTITAPTSNQTLTGYSGFSFTSTLSSAPSAAEVCYAVDAYEDFCSRTAPYSVPYNTFDHLNGPHSVIATAYDSLGAVVVASAAVSFTTANTWPANCSITVTTGTALGSNWVGTVNVTPTVTGSCSSDSNTFTLYVDGVTIATNTATSTQVFPLDTSVWANGTHIIALHIVDSTGGTNYSCGYVGDIAQWSRKVTFANGAAVNSLRTNIHEAFIIGTGTDTITANLLNADGTTTAAASLVFYSQDTRFATVNQSTGVITGVTQGRAKIRAMDVLVTGTDLTCVGPCSTANVSSASHCFTFADQGKVIQITGGTGWTTGFYEVNVAPGNCNAFILQCVNGVCSNNNGGNPSNPGSYSLGPSRTVWALVNTQNILPHFSTDGAVITAFTPGKSFIPHSIFSSNAMVTDVAYVPGFLSDMQSSGYNTLEVAITNQDMSGAAGQAAFQSGQTSYVNVQESNIAPFPRLRLILIGDNIARANGLFISTRSVSASWTPPAIQTVFNSWKGQLRPPIEAAMFDEVNTQWGFKPLQGPITFGAGSTQSGLSSIVASAGTCTVSWTAYSVNASSNFVISGSVTTGMNSVSGSTYVANAVNANSFTFSCPSVANGTYNITNDPGLMIEPYAAQWFSGDYARYNGFSQIMSQANSVSGRVPITWENSGGTTNTSVANWEGNGFGPFGSGQSLGGVNQMADTADIYWAPTSGYLARRQPGQSLISNVGDYTRGEWGAFSPSKPIILLTSGVASNYGFQGYSIGVTSLVNGLMTFSSPHLISSVVAGVTRLTLSGATGLNANYYVTDCPTNSTCHVAYEKTTFTGLGTGAVITFSDTTQKGGVTLTADGQNDPFGVIGGFVMGNNFNYTGGADPNVPTHRGQTFTVAATGGSAQSQFNSRTFLYSAANVTNDSQINTFREVPSGSATGGTAVIIADNLYVRGRNGGLGTDLDPGFTFGNIVEAEIIRAAGHRTYFYGSSPQAFSDTQGFSGPNTSTYLAKFGDTCNITVQSGLNPHYENDLVVPIFRGNSTADLLWTRSAKYSLQPALDSPDMGGLIETAVRSGSYGNMLLALNASDGPQTVTFTLTPYLQSGQSIVRFYANYQSIKLTTLAAGTATDTITMDSKTEVRYLFPVNYATELQQFTMSASLASVGGATKIAVRYAYDPYWLDQQSPSFDCGSGSCVLPVDLNIGTVYYRLIWLGSSGQVLATSSVLNTAQQSVQISGQVTITGQVQMGPNVSTGIPNDWLVKFNTGSNTPHGTVFAGGFFWALNESTPSTLVKIDPASPSSFVTTTFANDGHHNNGLQLVYTGGTLYAVFGDSTQISVSSINPSTLAISDVIADNGDIAGLKPGMATDGTYLYVLTYPSANSSKVLRYALAGFAKTSMTLSHGGGVFTSGHAIVYDGTKLYATGDSTPGWVSRINVSTFTEEDTETFIDTGGIPYGAATDDLAFDGTNLWIGIEGAILFNGNLVGNGAILKVNKSSLTPVAAVVQPGIGGGSPDPPNLGTFYNNSLCSTCSPATVVASPYVWAVYSSNPGTLVRIDPTSLAVQTFKFAPGQNQSNEIVTDGTSFYFTFFTSPGQASATKINEVH